MEVVRVSVPVYMPAWLHLKLRSIKRRLHTSSAKLRVDISGDRDVEWSFILAHMPSGPGKALDFGCGFGNLSLHAAQHGFHVMALDIQPQSFPWQHPNVNFVQGDLLRLGIAESHFDLVLNCSAVEHVGLAGRYGVTGGDPEGDLKIMSELRRLMKPGGIMLLTTPCGQDAVFAPMHRVYGARRLPRLVDGYIVEEQLFWVKNDHNQWVASDRSKALAVQPYGNVKDPSRCSYALGCFVLRRPQ
jgi:SAM-dependent methyltransferase